MVIRVKKRLEDRLQELGMDYEAYVEMLINADLDRKFKINSRVYYDNVEDSLYCDNIKVYLTKIQHSFIKLLIKARGDLVLYEDIMRTVWHGKDCSIFTMRNQVMKIREITCSYLIKNVSNKGYCLVIEDE